MPNFFPLIGTVTLLYPIGAETVQWADQSPTFLFSGVRGPAAGAAGLGVTGKGMQDGTLDRIRPLIVSVVEFSGMELVQVEMRREGIGLVLRLYIDKEGGVTLDDCVRVSRQVSAQLDAEDPISGRYTLEISSPGLDRPLASERDFQRFAGQRVKVSTIAPLAGRRNFAGRLVGLVDSVVRLLLEDGHEVDIPKDLIAKARIVADFEVAGARVGARGRHE